MEQLLIESLKSAKAAFLHEKFFIGKQIKTLRIKKHMAQKQLAQKLGTSQSAVARMENGKQNFSIQTLIALARVFGKKLNVKFQ